MWKNRKLRLALTGLALGALALWAVRPAPVPVETAVARRGPLVVTVDEEGRTRVRERFVVAAPVSGRLERINLHEGDVVAAGEVMAHLAPSPLDPRAIAQARARLAAAEAARESAKALEVRARSAFDQAHRDRERAERLGQDGIQPAEGRERAASQELAAAADLSAATHAIGAAIQEVAEAGAALLAANPDARRRGGLAPVRAPMRGTVLRVLQESDRVVAAGTPLFEIGDLAEMELVVELLSSDAMRVKPGAVMWVSGFGGAAEVEARVIRVEPSGFTKVSALGVEEQRVNVVGDFLAPPKGVGDGYRVEARIVVWQDARALQVPGSALFRTGEEWRAFAVVDGRAVSRVVEVGERTDRAAAVLSGLVEGERVVLYPGDRVKEGTRVLPASGEAEAALPLG